MASNTTKNVTHRTPKYRKQGPVVITYRILRDIFRDAGRPSAKLPDDPELDSSVLLPPTFGLIVRNGTTGAKTMNGEPAGINPLADEIIVYRFRSLLRELQIV